MPSRLDYLIRKLDELEDAIRREKREYDKARDRYDKMRSRDILEDLRGQFLGYQTERDQLHNERSAAREKLRQNQSPPQHQRHPSHKHSAPPSNTQRGQPQAPPPPEYGTAQPHRPAPQHRDGCPPRNNYGPNGSAAGQTRGQPGNNNNKNRRPAYPRQHQKTQMVDYEIEEPDGRSYVVRGGAVFRDLDPARDTVRKPE